MPSRICSHVRRNIIGYVALFFALSGGAYAAAVVAPANSVNSRAIINGAVKTPDLADGAVTESKLANGAVTNTKLGPAVVASLTLHCPAELHRAADLCFDFDDRPDATWTTALKTCARAQLRLPDPGELALVFDHLGALQDYQWVASESYLPGVGLTGFLAGMLGQSASREIQPNIDNVTASRPYRCVTSVSN